VIVGRRAAIDRIKRNPLKRALRCDKLTLAALAATMRLYLRSRDLSDELPTLRILRRSSSEIGAIAPRAREILAERLGAGYAIEIVDTASQVGSGAMPVEELKSVALRVSHPEKSANAIAAMFRRARIIGRVADDSFILDLRAIEDPAVFSVKLETD
jgi:L-seryl-tRNA(Ser) seleniumtransferase